jgi:hypothetical protein
MPYAATRLTCTLPRRPVPRVVTRRGARIWARAGAVYVRKTDRIYVATGNEMFAPVRHEWSESVAALYPIVANGALYVADESHGLTAYAVTRQGVPSTGPAR